MTRIAHGTRPAPARGWFAGLLPALLACLLAGAAPAPANPVQRVAVLDSRLDHRLGADGERERQEQRPLLWLGLLRGLRLDADILSDERLEKDALQGYDLLVLPDARVLTARQTEIIVAFLRRGNALILTGRSGAEILAETGGAQRESLAQVLGLAYHHGAAAPARESSSWWVIMDQPHPLSAGIPVMQHLAVEATVPALLHATQESLAFWMETGASDETYDSAAARSAMRAGTLGDGHYLWLGFAVDQLGGDLESSEAFHRLLNNALRWFGDEVTLTLDPWPHPHRAAISFSMDTETAFGNIQYVHSVENLRAITYFLLTDASGLHVQTLQSIVHGGADGRAIGEIAVHGDSHANFKGQPRAMQSERLKHTHRYLRETIGVRPLGMHPLYEAHDHQTAAFHRPAGFRPPEEAYDYHTLQALVDAGYLYLFADDNPVRNTPKVLHVDNQRLIQFPMLNKDDIKLIVMTGLPTPEKALDSYIQDMSQIFRREGLYMANLHSHVLGSPDYIGVLRDVVAYAVAQGAWQATCLDVARWWLRREAVGLHIIESRSDLLRFQVANRGTETVENLSLSLWLPGKARTPRLDLLPAQRRILDYRQDGARLRFTIPVLMPDDIQEYRLTWQD